MKKLVMAAVAVLGLAAVSTFSGCSLKKDDNAKSVSQLEADKAKADAERLKAEGRLAEAAAKLTEAADKYARLGEMLLVPEGLEYADDFFNKALEVDPSNAKANFYKVATGPAMKLKGFFPRVEKLVNSDDIANFDKAKDDLAKKHMPEVTAFANTLPEGQKPFASYYDIQRFMREQMLPAVLQSIDNLDKIDVSKQPLQLNFSPERATADIERHYSSYYYYSTSYCRQDPVQGWTCDYYTSQYDNGQRLADNQYFVDKHDLKIIRSLLMAIADQIRLGTAYSAKDAEFIAKQLHGIDAIRRDSGSRGLTSEDIVRTLKRPEFSQFLTLEKDSQLAEVMKSSARALQNGLELAAMREELCDHPTRTKENALIRPICIEAKAVDALQISLDAIAGPKEIQMGRSGNHVTRIVIDLSVLGKNPPKDLKAFLPTEFDAQGNPTNFADPTMGGLFPNGDFIHKIRELVTGNSTERVLRDFRRGLREAVKHL